MKILIKKLEIASFGCLKNKSLTPDDAMNAITAPNESGKSTTAAFIKFMFYGFGSPKKDIMDSDRKLYLPWDSPFAAGALELTADGVLYRIERKFAPSQKEVLSITEVSTGKSVFQGLCPGEVFFGVDVETAEKTFIFDQYCALTSKDSELFDSIRNIIFSGDENGNSENALKRLKEQKKELKNSRGGGIIEALEKEFEKYKSAYDKSMEKVDAVKETVTQISNLQKNIERNSQNEKKLLEEKENHEKYQAHLKLIELDELEKEATNAENAYKIAISSLEGAGIPDGELLEGLVNANAEKLSLKALREELSASLTKAEGELSVLESKSVNCDETTEEIKDKLSVFSKGYKVSYLFATLLCISGAAVAVASLLKLASLLPLSAILLAPAVILAITGTVKKSGKKKYIKSFGAESEAELLALLNAREETNASKEQKALEISSIRGRINSVDNELYSVEERLTGVLGRYFKTAGEDSADLIRRLRGISEKVAEAKKIAESKKSSLAKTSELLNRQVLIEKAKGATPPTRTIEEIDKQLKFVQNGKKLMEEKIIEAEKNKAVMEASITPPSMLFEKAESVYKKLLLAKERLSAIQLSIELIEKASEEMKATLAPKITSYASELFSIATDGKYKSLNVTTELSLTTDNGETVKSAEYLSAGARATAYICLRLALMKAIYNDNFPPIILDDAFVRLDPKRLEQIWKAIYASSAKDTQLFVFSCDVKNAQSVKREDY
jgi:uncharacterized protein YhaN